jgi:hypothetical protein
MSVQRLPGSAAVLRAWFLRLTAAPHAHELKQGRRPASWSAAGRWLGKEVLCHCIPVNAGARASKLTKAVVHYQIVPISRPTVRLQA